MDIDKVIQEEHADDGNNCKHMAAVLYEIEEQEGSDSLTEGSSGSEQAEEEVEEIIEKIPETELLAAGV